MNCLPLQKFKLDQGYRPSCPHLRGRPFGGLTIAGALPYWWRSKNWFFFNIAQEQHFRFTTVDLKYLPFGRMPSTVGEGNDLYWEMKMGQLQKTAGIWSRQLRVHQPLSGAIVCASDDLWPTPTVSSQIQQQLQWRKLVQLKTFFIAVDNIPSCFKFTCSTWKYRWKLLVTGVGHQRRCGWDQWFRHHLVWNELSDEKTGFGCSCTLVFSSSCLRRDDYIQRCRTIYWSMSSYVPIGTVHWIYPVGNDTWR